MKRMLQDLFAYNQDANRKLITQFEAIASPPAASIRLFSHVLNAMEVWLARMEGRKSRFGVWDLHELSDFGEIEQQLHDALELFMESHDLLESLTYQNSKGDRFSNSRRDILLHLVNHSTYHRGQIAQQFKAAGIEPPITDYIFYKRNIS